LRENACPPADTPGENQAHFYTLVSQDTVEQDFALKRQLFLCEQGYQYEIHDIEQMRQKKLAEQSCPKLPFPTNMGVNE